MITIVGTVAIVVIAIAAGLVIDRRLAPTPDELAGKPQVRAGESAAAAIRANPAQLARLRATQRCARCRAVMRPLDDEAIRYADRRMIVLHFRCPDCGQASALYVEPAG